MVKVKQIMATQRMSNMNQNEDYKNNPALVLEVHNRPAYDVASHYSQVCSGDAAKKLSYSLSSAIPKVEGKMGDYTLNKDLADEMECDTFNFTGKDILDHSQGEEVNHTDINKYIQDTENPVSPSFQIGSK